MNIEIKLKILLILSCCNYLCSCQAKALERRGYRTNLQTGMQVLGSKLTEKSVNFIFNIFSDYFGIEFSSKGLVFIPKNLIP